MICPRCNLREIQYKAAQLCKVCYNKQLRLNGYGDSLRFKCNRLWADLKHRAKRKGISLYMTNTEFYEFAKSSDTLKQLHQAWLASDKQYKLTATVDRIDNTKGYELSNIQFLTLSENSTKGQKEKRDMGIVSGSRPCVFTKKNKTLAFNSAAEVGRYFGKDRGVVACACRNERYLINGYSCKYL